MSWSAKIRRWLLVVALNSVIMSSVMPNRPRRFLLRRLGVRVGDAWFASRSHLSGADLAVGDGSRIGHRVFFDAGPIIIGREVSVGTDARFLTGTHELGDATRRAGALRSMPIVVGDGVWIGAGVTVLGGVTIGNGSVVGAGAVVIDDTKPHALYVGVPATFKRDLPTS